MGSNRSSTRSRVDEFWTTAIPSTATYGSSMEEAATWRRCCAARVAGLGACSRKRVPDTHPGSASRRSRTNGNRRGSHNMASVIDSYRLTPMQEGMLFQSLRADYAGVDVEQIMCRLREDLDIPTLLRAWKRVVAGHPALRTAFRWHDVEWPVQEVYADASLPVRHEDWRESGRADQEARLRDFLARDRQEGFDLRIRPLLRLAFLRVGDLDYRMVWTFHHIVVDGRSQLIV